VGTPWSQHQDKSGPQGELSVELLPTDAPWNLGVQTDQDRQQFEYASLEDPLELRLGPGVRRVDVRGRLQRAGMPLAYLGAEVLRLGSRGRIAYWNEQGEFAFKLMEPGRYDLSLAGVLLQVVEVTEAGLDIDLGELSLDSFLQLDLTLLDAEGQPVVDESFHAYPVALDPAPFSQLAVGKNRRRISLRTDDTGHALTLLPGPGSYGISLDRGRSIAPQPLHLEADGARVLSLPAQRLLHVRLVDKFTREALQNRWMSRHLFDWRRPGERASHGVSVSEGHAGRLDLRLPAGELELTIRPWQWGMLPKRIRLPATLETTEQAPLVIELEPAEALEIRIEEAEPGSGSAPGVLWRDAFGKDLTYYFVHESEFHKIREPLSEAEAAQLLGAGEFPLFTDMGIYTQQLQFEGTANSVQVPGLQRGRYRILAVNDEGQLLEAPFEPEVFEHDGSKGSIVLRRTGR